MTLETVREDQAGGHSAATYVFMGHHSIASNAVFSQLDIARSWVRAHRLTGKILLHAIDDPAFDRLVPNGQVGPRPMPSAFGTAEVDPASYIDENAVYLCKNGLLDDHPDYRREVNAAWRGQPLAASTTPPTAEVSQPDEDERKRVYVFVGTGWATAVFSSLESSRSWVAKHLLSGHIYQHQVDCPDFDRDLSTGQVMPKRQLRDVFDAGGSHAGYREFYSSLRASPCVQGRVLGG